MAQAPQMAQVLSAQPAQPAGQASVIVDTVGDWLVCEDGAGQFYYHNPTEQSFDEPPPEFLAMFPGGYAPPPLGAFASANMDAPQETFQQQMQPQQARVIEYMEPQVMYAQPQNASYVPQ